MDFDRIDRSEEISCDSLFSRRLHCLQHRSGYRFSVDAVLAAHFSVPPPGANVLDLCAGCGIIALICLYRWQERIAAISCLELQPKLVSLAHRNMALNGFTAKTEVKQGDLRSILNSFPAESFAQVICNPPFYKKNSGRPCRDQESFIARHQVHCSLHEVVAAAAAVSKNRGKAVFIYPAAGLNTLIFSLQCCHLVPKRLQIIYSYPGADARLVLIETVKNGGEGLEILAPLYIYERRMGAYSREMQQLYAADWSMGDASSHA